MESHLARKNCADVQVQPPRSRRPLTLRAKIALFVFSVVLATLLGEVVVRIGKPGFPGFRLPQVEHRTVRGLGFEMVPNQIAYSNASKVAINSVGFRGPEIRTGSAAGEPRVLCLGDSMTFGVAVEDHETYPQQLEQLLVQAFPSSRPEVINAGVQRYFTFQEIDLLKAHVQKLQPDVVTLMVYINDLSVRRGADYVREYENEREQAATAFRKRAPILYLAAKNSALVELAKIAYFVSRRNRRAVPSLSMNALQGRSTKRDEPKWQAVEQELATFRDMAQAHRFKPIVLFVPVRRQIEGDYARSLYPGRLVEHCRRLGMPTIDATQMFKESLRAGVDPFLPWDDHMSVAGHRLFAETIMEQLRREIPGNIARTRLEAPAP
jgi:lysophospholipase L1-like esterase